MLVDIEPASSLNDADALCLACKDDNNKLLYGYGSAHHADPSKSSENLVASLRYTKLLVECSDRIEVRAHKVKKRLTEKPVVFSAKTSVLRVQLWPIQKIH